MLLAARRQMREGMRNPPDPSIPFDDRVQLMEDVAVFLRRNIVQGVRVDGVSDGRPVYHLNIHKDTELGDNITASANGKGRNTLVRGQKQQQEQQEQELDNDDDKNSRTDCCGGYGGAV